MDYSLILSIWTIVVMVLFIGIVLWAWSGKRKQRFDDAANIPFAEDEEVLTDSDSRENSHG
jgi:cytochrome c oxidase cbb3-type subunit 4